jgi:hypothetical protein
VLISAGGPNFAQRKIGDEIYKIKQGDVVFIPDVCHIFMRISAQAV